MNAVLLNFLFIKINNFIFMDKTAVYLNNANIKALFIEDSEITRHVSCPCCNFAFQPDLKHLQLPVTPCCLLLSTETLGKLGFTLMWQAGYKPLFQLSRKTEAMRKRQTVVVSWKIWPQHEACLWHNAMMKPECKWVCLTEMWPGGKCLSSLGCRSGQVIC